jgi:hypothetical protein
MAIRADHLTLVDLGFEFLKGAFRDHGRDSPELPCAGPVIELQRRRVLGVAAVRTPSI